MNRKPFHVSFIRRNEREASVRSKTFDCLADAEDAVKKSDAQAACVMQEIFFDTAYGDAPIDMLVIENWVNENGWRCTEAMGREIADEPVIAGSIV